MKKYLLLAFPKKEFRRYFEPVWLGLRDFGENYAQELNEKSLALNSKNKVAFYGPNPN